MAKEYIEREAALAAQNKSMNLAECRKRLERLPAADVAPVRHGRWKPYDLTCGMSIYHCSACGQASDVPTRMGKPIYNYCPNCGAKMEVQDV